MIIIAWHEVGSDRERRVVKIAFVVLKSKTVSSFGVMYLSAVIPYLVILSLTNRQGQYNQVPIATLCS
jgi:hypothetical protein